MRSLGRHSGGFSLLELLIVIGIITLLLGILLPVIAGVRSASRATWCLANLQQWGQSYQMYVSANHGRSLSAPDGRDPKHLEWWEQLASYNGNTRSTLLCPEATEPLPGPAVQKNFIKGTAHAAWQVNFHGQVLSSYGLNEWLFELKPGPGAMPGYFHLPVRQPDRIPLLGDCCDFREIPTDGDPVPTNLETPTKPDVDEGLAEFCINRHQMAVNIVFVDGHAERVQLGDLWKLKWSDVFRGRNVVITGP